MHGHCTAKQGPLHGSGDGVRCGKERMEEVFWPCPPAFTLQADAWLGSSPCRDGEACCASWERAALPCCFPTLEEVSRGGEAKPRLSLACGMCLLPLACLSCGPRRVPPSAAGIAGGASPQSCPACLGLQKVVGVALFLLRLPTSFRLPLQLQAASLIAF